MRDQKNAMVERLREILKQETGKSMCEDQDEKPDTKGGVVIGDITGENITVTINCTVAPGSSLGGPRAGLWRSLQSQVARRLGPSKIRNDHLVSNRVPPSTEASVTRKPAEILLFRPPHGV